MLFVVNATLDATLSLNETILLFPHIALLTYMQLQQATSFRREGSHFISFPADTLDAETPIGLIDSGVAFPGRTL